MKRGSTLIELLVVMVLMGIMMTAFTQIYINGMRVYREQFSQTKLDTDLQTIVDRITSDIKGAEGIASTYASFTASPTILILKTPALDSSQDFIYNGEQTIPDYIIYYQDGTSLHRIIYAHTESTRFSLNGQDKILSTKMSALTFNYDPDINTPTRISVDMSLSEKVGKGTRSSSLTGKAKLRNSL